MSRIRKWLAVVMVVLAGVLGFNTNAYADDEGGDKIKYFNIDVTVNSTERNCSATNIYLDANPEMKCDPDKVTTKTYTVEIAKQYDAVTVNNSYAYNADGLRFRVNSSDGRLVITVDDKSNSAGKTLYSGVVKGKTIENIKGTLERKLKTTTVQPIGNIVSRTYTFGYSGGIQERDATTAATGSSAASDPDAVQPTCMNSGDLNTLGWILCPVMELLSDAAQGTYDNFVEPALQVDPVLFAGGTTDGTEQAWSVFRDISNVLFVILLLVVIFSQITGVGIDNYGIKKVLPKMIVAGILINLSYWICVAAVDLSNIIGYGLQDLFNRLPTGNADAAASGMGIEGVGTGLLTAAVIAGGIVTAVFAAGGGVALALTLVVALIGVVVSVFFLFILLAAREAAVVVLTVVSPIMIVLYMLPNTKNMFDKWKKFLWALLLVYPICGLLVGGGNFVSKLLLVAGAGSEGFFSALVAMLAGIIPIFFIPTVLRNSMNAAGQLGTKISGMGQRVGGRLSSNVDKTARGSERFKNYQTDRDRQRKINAARRTAARYEGRDLGSLSDRQRRRLAQAAGIEDRAEQEVRNDNTALMMRDTVGMGEEQLMAQWDQAFDAGDTSRLDSLTRVLTSRYGTSAANRIGQSLDGKHDIANNKNYQRSMKALQQTMREDSNFAGNMKNKASDAYQMISNGGMSYNENTGQMEYKDLGHFSANNGISTDIKDWSTQSAATLQRAIDSGQLTPEMIQNILDSDDPSIQSGIQSDAKKRDVLQAALQNNNGAGVGPNLPVEAAAAQYRADRQAEAEAPTIRSSGAYEHSSGNVVQLHEMSDGTFVDAQNGQTVDITHYKKR